jgi:hypothetical protein
MPTSRYPIHHPHRGRLSPSEEMALRYGDLPGRPAFRDEGERREAWARHRHRLLAGYQHGRRPAGWWSYDAPIPYPGYDREQSTLYGAGLLAEPESAELVAWWREQFERAQRPDFFFCRGPGSFLRGSAARREHFRWADIPAELVKKWRAERRRRDRTIRKLKATIKGPDGEDVAGL